MVSFDLVIYLTHSHHKAAMGVKLKIVRYDLNYFSKRDGGGETCKKSGVRTVLENIKSV